MHDGRFKSLLEVVAFYNRGGGHGLGKDPALRPLFLDERELSRLVEFLQALTESTEMDSKSCPQIKSAR